jgi:hypothetical protein
MISRRILFFGGGGWWRSGGAGGGLLVRQGQIKRPFVAATQKQKNKQNWQKSEAHIILGRL